MAWIRSLWGFIVRVGKRFSADACAGRAAGLAFSSLFALVPLSAFVVAVLTAFGAFDPLIEEAQQALIQQLVPAVHEEVFASVRQFASNTRALGFLGFLIFIATAILLIRNVSNSFNAIWGFRTRRGIWSNIASYTSIIVIGTTLISASFALGPVVQTVIEASFPDAPQVTWLRTFLVPPILVFATIFTLNMLVPAGKIHPPSAAVGAAVTVVIWEVAKRIFVFWSSSVMRLNLIYGSLAVLPIFLIWLYLTWFFILIGVEVAYSFQHRHENPTDDTRTDGPVSLVVEQCVVTVLEIVRRHRSGEAPLTGDGLDQMLGSAMADRVRRSLVESRLFLDTDRGILPARSAEQITVDDFVQALLVHDHRLGSEAGEAEGNAKAEQPWHGLSGRSAASRLIMLWREDPDTVLTDHRVWPPAPDSQSTM